MKTRYTTPVITVEELLKADVLCASTEGTTKAAASAASQAGRKVDNINQMFSTLGDVSNLL